jgi:hypothetical protein
MRPYWRSESPRVPTLRNAREENFEVIVIDHFAQGIIKKPPTTLGQREGR